MARSSYQPHRNLRNPTCRVLVRHGFCLSCHCGEFGAVTEKINDGGS
jgi:hypothetical protein